MCVCVRVFVCAGAVCVKWCVYVCKPVYPPACLHVSVCSTTYTIRCAHQFQFNAERSAHTRAFGPSGGKKCATLLYEYDVFFIVTISAQSYFSHSLRSFELEAYCQAEGMNTVWLFCALFSSISHFIYYEDLYCLLNCVPFARLMEIHLHTCVRNRANKTYYYSIG